MNRKFYYGGKNITKKFIKAIEEYESSRWLSQRVVATKLRVSVSWFNKNYHKYTYKRRER